MSAIIYKITNTLNGKAYIGFTTDTIEDRWRKHCNASRIGRRYHFLNAIQKYGEDVWDFQTLYEGENEEWMLRVAEPFFIALYHTFLGEGYNSTSGGDGCLGHKHSEESKKKMREFQRKHNPTRGRPISDEHKLKISGKNSPKWNGMWETPYGIFESIRSASRESGVPSSTIEHRCNHKTKFADWGRIR